MAGFVGVGVVVVLAVVVVVGVVGFGAWLLTFLLRGVVCYAAFFIGEEGGQVINAGTRLVCLVHDVSHPLGR